MKMQNGFLIFGAVLLYGTILLSPAFADMKKANDQELAQANASVTGETVKDPKNAAAKASLTQDFAQTGAVTVGDAFVPTSIGGIDTMTLILNISGQETFRYSIGGVTTISTGGITSVKPH